MRTNIGLDDVLVAEAMSATGLRTKKSAVEEVLRRLVRAERQRKAIEDMRGLGWDADAAAIREPPAPIFDP